MDPMYPHDHLRPAGPPPTLVGRWVDRFLASVDPADAAARDAAVDPSPLLDAFAAFVARDLAAVPHIATQRDESGELLHFADRSVAVLAATPQHQRPSYAMPVTGAVNRYEPPAYSSQPIPVTGVPRYRG